MRSISELTWCEQFESIILWSINAYKYERINDFIKIRALTPEVKPQEVIEVGHLLAKHLKIELVSMYFSSSSFLWFLWANNLRRLHFCSDTFHEYRILFAAFMLIAYCAYAFMHSSATLIRSAYKLVKFIKLDAFLLFLMICFQKFLRNNVIFKVISFYGYHNIIFRLKLFTNWRLFWKPL